MSRVLQQHNTLSGGPVVARMFAAVRQVVAEKIPHALGIATAKSFVSAR